MDDIKVTNAQRCWIDLAAGFSAQMNEYQAEVVPAAIADELLRALVATMKWFDDNRPQIGPGTLPIWVVDARAAIASATNGRG